MSRGKNDVLGPVLVLVFLIVWLAPHAVIVVFKFLAIALLCFFLVILIITIFGAKSRGEKNSSFESFPDKKSLPPPSSPRIGGNAIDREIYAKKLPDAEKGWTAELLAELEWKRFEEICADYFEIIGFKPKIQKYGPDGGIDISLFWRDSPKPVAIAQCKAWTTTYKVGVKDVRELFGVMISEGVKEAFFLTSSSFTREAERFVVEKKLTLVDGRQLLRRIKELPEEQQKTLLERATRGDYKTPTCSSCGIKMKLRSNRRGKFWGCPKCRHTMKCRKDVRSVTYSIN